MEFKLGEYTFEAENCIDGIFINPQLPENFDDTDNSMRPDSHDQWWYRPYIVTESRENLDRTYAERTDEYAEEGRSMWEEGRKKWMEAYPTGIAYSVRCLDGGAWDRSTNYGNYGDIDAAIAQAKSLIRE